MFVWNSFQNKKKRSLKIFSNIIKGNLRSFNGLQREEHERELKISPKALNDNKSRKL